MYCFFSFFWQGFLFKLLWIKASAKCRHTHTPTNTYTHMHTHRHKHTHSCTQTHTHPHIYIHSHKRKDTDKHTHTHSHNSLRAVQQSKRHTFNRGCEWVCSVAINNCMLMNVIQQVIGRVGCWNIHQHRPNRQFGDSGFGYQYATAGLDFLPPPHTHTHAHAHVHVFRRI